MRPRARDATCSLVIKIAITSKSLIFRSSMLLRAMRCYFLIGLAAAVAFAGGCNEGLAQTAVATPAIDTSIFKDGAVEDKKFKFDDWSANCRQIVKIKKRVCNLLSSVVDYRGDIGGSVIIASTDTGIPAMMIALPFEMAQEKPIAVRASSIGKVDGKVVKVEFETTSRPMICDTSCKYMFPWIRDWSSFSTRVKQYPSLLQLQRGNGKAAKRQAKSIDQISHDIWSWICRGSH